MSTTDDRLRRLTELARKVPGWDASRLRVIGDGDSCAVVELNDQLTLDYRIDIDEASNALDMLEAALLVGAGELSPAEHALHAITNEFSTLALTWQHRALTAGNAEVAELCELHADAVRRVLLAARAVAMGGVGDE